MASQAVSLITKPTLLYYSIMCLAVVEFLFKKSGAYSIDKLREKHSHHGLHFFLSSIPTPDTSNRIIESLSCRPAIRENSARYGTFEIWHDCARHAPLVSKFINYIPNGKSSTIRATALSDDNRIGLLPDSGISLLEACSYIPGMLPTLHEIGITSNTVRAKSDFSYHSSDKSWSHEIIIQSGTKDIIDNLLKDFTFSPSISEMIDYNDLGNGGIIKIQSLPDLITSEYKIRFPSCSCPSFPDLYFWSEKYYLNEFGFLYVSLYIIGNYSHYFADKWVSDVENYTELAFLASNLVRVAEDRMFLLTLSELAGEYLIPLREMPA